MADTPPFEPPCPRPETLSEDDIDEWTHQFNECAEEREDEPGPGEEIMAILFPDWKRTPPLEVWLCGQWLHRELIACGCEFNLASRICFASRQRIAAQIDPDPWAVANACVREYQEGRSVEPGEELAIRLMAGQFPALVRRFGQPPADAIQRAKELSVGMASPVSPF